MKEQVLKVLQEECPDIDFTTSKELVTGGMLDSITITTIIAALTMEFGIEIPYEEVVEENFDSLDAIVKLVEKLS
ncbi:MAG: acyl carrier protein [Ruminococcaceae bacterium]|jgi:acyl carrier protein|nr:acyl carrier protein [Oscillospiraceae bacterium]